MTEFIGSPSFVYRLQLRTILDVGEDVEVRGLRTKEILHAVTHIPNPRQRMTVVPGRRLNPFLAMSEAIWLLAGRQDIEVLKPYNKRIGQFSDDGTTLYGAYGYRIKDQLWPLIRRLKEDKHDRRAVLSIWRPEDLTAETKDPPCNDLIMFKWRRAQLHMMVINRSNDLHWGLHAVNLPQFSVLQEYIAARLGASPGSQIHISDSLHVYLDGPAAALTERMVAHEEEKLRLPLQDAQLFRVHTAGSDLFWEVSHETFLGHCDQVLDQHHFYTGGVFFLEFANDFLRAYAEKMWNIPTLLIRHAGRYQGWMAVGQEWMNTR